MPQLNKEQEERFLPFEWTLSTADKRDYVNLSKAIKNHMAEEISLAVEQERKSWYSPFDGLEIKLMYRDGNKVFQNKHIFSLEQINFIGSIYEVARLKFGYMLKDLLGSISQQSNKEEVIALSQKEQK